MHGTIQELNKLQLRTDIPDFGPGDTVRVHVRVREGDKERIQVFEGAVLGRKGGGLHETFTVLVQRRRRADLPGAQPDGQANRGGDARPGAKGEAHVSALAQGQGRQDYRETHASDQEIPVQNGNREGSAGPGARERGW